MTSGLRKAHKFIWIVLIIVVPIVMYFSIKDLDIFSLENNRSSQTNSSKEVSIKTSENEIIKVSVFESHIDIILKSSLKNASSVIYEMDEKGNKARVIGQLTTAGVYTFNQSNLPKGIIIYDDIKQVEITKLSF